MSFEIPRENLIIIPVSFGVGLLLAGRHILGTAAIIIGAVAYLKSKQLETKSAHKPEVHWNDLSFKEKLISIDSWYYSNDGEIVGPLGEGAVLHLFKSHKIAKNSLVYNSIISNEWIPFEQTHLYRNQIDKS